MLITVRDFGTVLDTIPRAASNFPLHDAKSILYSLFFSGSNLVILKYWFFFLRDCRSNLILRF